MKQSFAEVTFKMRLEIDQINQVTLEDRSEKYPGSESVRFGFPGVQQDFTSKISKNFSIIHLIEIRSTETFRYQFLKLKNLNETAVNYLLVSL